MTIGTATPWCPDCEWNLLKYEPATPAGLGWRWLDRLSHRTAVRLDRSLFAELSVEEPRPVGLTIARGVLLLSSIALLLAILGAFVLGCVLLAMHRGPWRIVFGALLVVLAIALRPPLGRVPRKRDRVGHDQAPTLLALVERVANRIGAPMPDQVVADRSFNASVSRTGLRQRTTLTLGLPLWLVCTPQQRVALLAHEFGHTVNGDPRRGLMIRPALATFGRLAAWAGVERNIGYVLDPDRPDGNLYQLVIELALWVVSRICLVPHLALLSLAMRDHQRAEYLADELAARMAGTDAAVSMLDASSLAPVYLRVIGYSAETHAPEQWHALVAEAIADREQERLPRRQLSRRHTSVWDSHPPDGLRAQVLELRPRREAALVLGENASAQIDRELAGHYRELHEHVLGTRDFRPLVTRHTGDLS